MPVTGGVWLLQAPADVEELKSDLRKIGVRSRLAAVERKQRVTQVKQEKKKKQRKMNVRYLVLASHLTRPRLVIALCSISITLCTWQTCTLCPTPASKHTALGVLHFNVRKDKAVFTRPQLAQHNGGNNDADVSTMYQCSDNPGCCLQLKNMTNVHLAEQLKDSSQFTSIDRA